MCCVVNMNKVIHIAVLPGDGIGREVMDAALPIFAALDVPVKINIGDIGWSCWQEAGDPVPEHTWQLIREADATLVGAITSKPAREAALDLAPALRHENRTYVSPLIQLRQRLDLFANVRPCFGLLDNKKPFNCCIIRENTEGLYAGFDFHPVPAALKSLIDEQERWQAISSDDLSCSLRLQSKQGLTRLFEFAFQYAETQHMSRVTFADKPNVLRQSSAFARERFESVAGKYPHLKADILNVDAVAYWLVKRPEAFGVIVAENMFGDLLSDVGAAVMGGLGFAPSANIGLEGCYFEPVHGSGPRMKGNTANPSAMFLTIGLLLKQFGYIEQAEKIKQAVKQVVDQGRYLTYDLGGSSSTHEMAQAIISAACDRHFMTQLHQFSSTEISDALDACGVEGALLHIKPLIQGQKLIGPAYTIQYAPYEKTSDSFRSAADYIDHVPAGSVIVIDNLARVDCTVWGGILTQVALAKGIAGTIVHGAVRDINTIRKANYPLWCVDSFMRSGKNRVQKIGEQCPVMISGVTISPGDIMFADEHGVVVIPVRLVDQVIKKALAIQQTEKNIIDAVNGGARLAEARKMHRYDQPWLSGESH